MVLLLFFFLEALEALDSERDEAVAEADEAAVKLAEAEQAVKQLRKEFDHARY